MKTYSTKQAARRAGIHWVTLHRWLAAGAVRPSVAIRTNGSTFYRWTPADVARLRKHKAAHYRKGRGRRVTGKPSSQSRPRPVPSRET